MIWMKRNFKKKGRLRYTLKRKMTLQEFLNELHDDTQNLVDSSKIAVTDYEIVLRKEARDPKETTLIDLDFRNIDHETKTIQLITT